MLLFILSFTILKQFTSAYYYHKSVFQERSTGDWTALERRIIYLLVTYLFKAQSYSNSKKGNNLLAMPPGFLDVTLTLLGGWWGG